MAGAGAGDLVAAPGPLPHSGARRSKCPREVQVCLHAADRARGVVRSVTPRDSAQVPTVHQHLRDLQQRAPCMPMEQVEAELRGLRQRFVRRTRRHPRQLAAPEGEEPRRAMRQPCSLWRLCQQPEEPAAGAPPAGALERGPEPVAPEPEAEQLPEEVPAAGAPRGGAADAPPAVRLPGPPPEAGGTPAASAAARHALGGSPPARLAPPPSPEVPLPAFAAVALLDQALAECPTPLGSPLARAAARRSFCTPPAALRGIGSPPDASLAWGATSSAPCTPPGTPPGTPPAARASCPSPSPPRQEARRARGAGPGGARALRLGAGAPGEDAGRPGRGSKRDCTGAVRTQLGEAEVLTPTFGFSHGWRSVAELRATGFRS